jgi:hypothetical protein
LAPGSSESPSTAKHLLLNLLGSHSKYSRYTLTKFRDFDTYARTTNSMRHAAVILLSPVPSLLISLLLALIPLQDPALGLSKNLGFLAHFIVTMALVIFGSVHQIRAPNAISRDDISNLDAALIAVIGAGLLAGIVTVMAYVWRFPIPFVWITALVPFMSTVVVAHVIVLGRKLWKAESSVRHAFLLFLPTFFIQATQVVAYPVFSVIFEVAGVWGQIALSIVFPIVKAFYRTAVRRLLRHLREDANEVAVSGIEICAAMYQSMIMQSVPSPFAFEQLPRKLCW